MPYFHDQAVDYAQQWAYGRNPAYGDFSAMGGDCTNFVSQCIFAGCGVMNYTRDVGWYYRSMNDRAAAWTSVIYLHKFLVGNSGRGPFGREVPLWALQPGDIIQLELNLGRFSHTLLVMDIGYPTRPDNILLTTHSFDSHYRPLSTYQYRQYRGIQLLGARE